MLSFRADRVLSALRHDADRDEVRSSQWDIPTHGHHIDLVAWHASVLRAGDTYHPEFTAPDPVVPLSSQRGPQPCLPPNANV